MCFFIPLQFGCPTKISQLDDEKNDIRICPQCHNAAVYACKTRTWFEFCFVPLIPFKSSKIWLCSICRWQSVKAADGSGPQSIAGMPPPGGGYNAQPPMNPGGPDLKQTVPNQTHAAV